MVKPIAVGADGRPARICVFCQSAEELTREHVFAAKWRTTHELGYPDLSREGWFATRDPENPVVRIDKKFPKQDPFTWTAKVACKSCNTGWMRRLEEAVDPYLAKLAFAEDVTLSVAELRTLEKWLHKTMIVVETMDDGAKSISFDKTRLLVGDDTPEASPVGALTWIEPVEVNKSNCFGSTIGSIVRTDHECSGHHLRVASAQLGSVAFVTCYSHDPIAIERVETARSFRPSKLVPGWDGVTWTLDRSSPLPSGAVRELQHRLFTRLGSESGERP